MSWKPPEVKETEKNWQPPEVADAEEQSLTPTGLSPLNPSPIAESASKAYTPVLKYGGAIGGALVAAPLDPATLGTASVAGGVLGYGIGGELAQKLDELIGVAESPKTTKEVVEKTKENLKEGAMMELGGRVIAKPIEAGLKFAGKPIATVVAKSPEYLASISQKARQFGIDLTPAELAGTKAIHVVESILDNLPWTTGIIQRHRLEQLQKLNMLRDKLIAENGSGADIEDLGRQIMNIADDYVGKLRIAHDTSIDALNASKEAAITGVQKSNEEISSQMANRYKSAMNGFKNRLLQKIGSQHTYEELGISSQQAVQEYQKQLSEKIRVAYDNVAQLIPDEKVVPEYTIKVANKIIEEQNSIAPGARNTSLLNAAKFMARTSEDLPPGIMNEYQLSTPSQKMQLEEAYPELKNPTLEKSYTDLSNNVQAFNMKKAQQTTETHGAYQLSNVGRQWGDLIKAMQTDMNTLVGTSGNKELIAANSIANGLFKQKMALFDDPAFKMINDKYPGAVVKTIFKSDPVIVKRYKALVGDKLFNKAKNRLTNDILGLEKDVVDGDTIRKGIVQLGESAKEIYSPQELTYFKKLADAVDTGAIGESSALEAQALSTKTNINDITSSATDILKKREENLKELLSNPLLKKIITRSAEMVPSGVAKAVVRPQNIGAAREAEYLFGSSGKKKIADAFLPHLLSTGQNGDFLPQTFAKQFDTYGYNTIKEWYGKDFADTLKNLADMGRRMSGVQKLASTATTGSHNLIGFYEGKRLGTLAALGMAGAAGFGIRSNSAVLTLAGEGAVILGTRQLAKLYTTPIGKNLFVQGLITPQTSKTASQIAGRILAIIGNETEKAMRQ